MYSLLINMGSFQSACIIHYALSNISDEIDLIQIREEGTNTI